VIREARLDAWETYSHPDLGTVGHPEEAREPAFTIQAIKTAFLQNETLADAGVTFKALAELDTDFDLNENQHSDSIYCLQYPDNGSFQIEAEEGTLAETIASHHQGIGVTFSPELADQYPSLRFLAPGSPLFTRLTDFLRENDDQSILVTHAYQKDSNDGLLSTSQKPWIVCGWTKGDEETSLVSLSDEGQVIELAANIESLQDWAQQFIETRSG